MPGTWREEHRELLHRQERPLTAKDPTGRTPRWENAWHPRSSKSQSQGAQSGEFTQVAVTYLRKWELNMGGSIWQGPQRV